MNVLKIIAGIFGGAAGVGIDMIISNAAKTVADANKIGKFGRILMGIGAAVCGAMVADKAAEYVDQRFQKIVDARPTTVAEGEVTDDE